MKALVILGSRNPKGQTARAAEAFLRGVTDGGGECEQFFLPQMRIERCRQCEDNGWGICRTEGRCVIEDDFASLVDKIRSADAAIFATPVYFSDLSESMRAFLDRLRRTCMNQSGKAGIAGKKAIGICIAGGGGGGASVVGVTATLIDEPQFGQNLALGSFSGAPQCVQYCRDNLPPLRILN